MKSKATLAFCGIAIAALSGCASIQKVPVSTDPSGAVVYLDGNKVCEATPCSVEMMNDQNHLLTIFKDGYRQKDIQLRPVQTSGGGKALSPDIVTVRLRTPDQPDISDKDSAVGTALDLGTEVLQRMLKDSGLGTNSGK